MKKQCNETQTGDIKGFSNMLYKVLGVIAITYPLLIVSNILSEIWRIYGLALDVISLGVFSVQLLRFDGSSVFIPAVTWGISIFPNSPVRNFAMAEATVIGAALLVAHCFIMVGILYLRNIFKQLKSGVSPFSTKMVGHILSIAWYATILTIFDTVNQRLSLVNIVLLVTTWLLYYIFEHGRKLQEESDATL